MSSTTKPDPATRPARRAPGVRLLDAIERIGNALPNPATLFLIFAGIVLLVSWWAASTGVSVVHPKDGSTLAAVNLLDAAGIRRIFTEAVRNFTGFAPLGTVLVAMLGIGIAEATGLVAVLMRAFVLGMPRGWITAAVVFVGINANQAADAGIILLPPVAALLFVAVGRHPLAGIAAAYAGVAGGFSANLLPSTLDVLLAGFTQEAVNASKLAPGTSVQVVGNWYFLAASTPFLTVLGTWVTHRFVEPRLGAWRRPDAAEMESAARGGGASLAPITPEEGRGLWAAGIALVLTVGLLLALILPEGAPLRDAGARSALEGLKPFFDSLVLWVFILFFVPGLAYGIATRAIRSDHDVARMAGDTMGSMGMYIVLAFAAAQFVSFFAWSNLGAILAITGADTLRGWGLSGAPLLAGFVVFAAVLNLFITSASAKWAILAPVFVPMFMLLGFTPEATQLVFRIGDSSTNIVTPLMPYLPFILTCAQRYDPKAGTGTLVAMMLPYSLAFLPMWTVLLMLFYALGWPIGPGVGIHAAGG
jgi:aminobenzoyl-glutamate transport protein